MYLPYYEDIVREFAVKSLSESMRQDKKELKGLIAEFQKLVSESGQVADDPENTSTKKQ